jgi:hypothetical protein
MAKADLRARVHVGADEGSSVLALALAMFGF